MTPFMICELGSKPIRLPSGKIWAGTIVPLDDDQLEKGEYRAYWCGKEINLTSLGLLADAVPEAKDAFYAMRATSASFDNSINGIPDPLEEVFTPVGFGLTLSRYIGHVLNPDVWSRKFGGDWIPVQVDSGVYGVLSGWCGIRNGDAILSLISDTGMPIGTQVTIVPKYADGVSLDVSISKRL